MKRKALDIKKGLTLDMESIPAIAIGIARESYNYKYKKRRKLILILPFIAFGLEWIRYSNKLEGEVLKGGIKL